MASKKKPAKKAQSKPAAVKPMAAAPAPAPKKPAKPKRAGKRFTPEQRAKILAEANAQKLTGKQVAKKYGISMVTYYLWRKKGGAAKTRGGAARRREVEKRLLDDVRTKVRQLLPGIIRTEVERYMSHLLGARKRR